MAEEAKWYVVHTYSGYENKVASNLEKTVENRQMQELIQEIRVPTEMVTEITDDGRRKEVERKIFPGYVIVKMVMTDESWYAVRNIRGCTGFVGPSSKPVPLTDAEVARLGIDQRQYEISYQVGDSVNIIDGPPGRLCGHCGRAGPGKEPHSGHGLHVWPGHPGGAGAGPGGAHLTGLRGVPLGEALLQRSRWLWTGEREKLLYNFFFPGPSLF